MKIIPPHKKKSRKVHSYAEIEDDINSIKRMLDDKKFIGKWKDAYAIHHSQVSNDPKNFFILNEAFTGKDKAFKKRVIINPEIVEEWMKKTFKEACMSYPFAPTRKLQRYSRVKVRFQIPSWFGLRMKTIEREYNDSEKRPGDFWMSALFQHECDHAKGVDRHDVKTKKEKVKR